MRCIREELQYLTDHNRRFESFNSEASIKYNAQTFRVLVWLWIIVLPQHNSVPYVSEDTPIELFNIL